MENVDKYLSKYLEELVPFSYTKEKLALVPSGKEYKLEKTIRIAEDFFLGIKYLNNFDTGYNHEFEFYSCKYPSPVKYPLFEEISLELLDKCVVPFNTFYYNKKASKYITSVINLHVYYVNNLMKAHNGQ